MVLMEQSTYARNFYLFFTPVRMTGIIFFSLDISYTNTQIVRRSPRNACKFLSTCHADEETQRHEIDIINSEWDTGINNEIMERLMSLLTVIQWFFCFDFTDCTFSPTPLSISLALIS